MIAIRIGAAVILVFVTLGDANAQDELFNYGEQWNRWSDILRSVYLQGFVDGQSTNFWALSNDLSPERREELRRQTFTFYESSALRDVMTDLYSDPANTFIRYDSMVYIARDKLDGDDIEPRLREARAIDRGYSRPPQ